MLVALIGSHTDCMIQQLVVTFTKPRCFPAGQLSLLLYFLIGIGSLGAPLAAWPPDALAALGRPPGSRRTLPRCAQWDLFSLSVQLKNVVKGYISEEQLSGFS